MAPRRHAGGRESCLVALANCCHCEIQCSKFVTERFTSTVYLPGTVAGNGRGQTMQSVD